jgi:hypothetical protein
VIDCVVNRFNQLKNTQVKKNKKKTLFDRFVIGENRIRCLTTTRPFVHFKKFQINLHYISVSLLFLRLNTIVSIEDHFMRPFVLCAFSYKVVCGSLSC